MNPDQAIAEIDAHYQKMWLLSLAARAPRAFVDAGGKQQQLVFPPAPLPDISTIFTDPRRTSPLLAALLARIGDVKSGGARGVIVVDDALLSQYRRYIPPGDPAADRLLEQPWRAVAFNGLAHGAHRLYGYGGDEADFRVLAVPFSVTGVLTGCFFLLKYALVHPDRSITLTYKWYVSKMYLSASREDPLELTALLHEYVHRLWTSFGWDAASLPEPRALIDHLPYPPLRVRADAIAYVGATFGMIRSIIETPGGHLKTADDPFTDIRQKITVASRERPSATNQLLDATCARLWAAVARAYAQHPYMFADLVFRTGDTDLLRHLRQNAQALVITAEEADRYDRFLAYAVRSSSAGELDALKGLLPADSHLYALSKLDIRRLLHHYVAVTTDPVFLSATARV